MVFEIINEFVPALTNLIVTLAELGLVTVVGVGIFVVIGKIGSIIGSLMTKAKAALE